VKLWGKIHGSERDYYVAEGILEGEDEVPEGQEEVEKPADFEPRGTGINKFSYWVNNNPIKGKWEKLPDLFTNDIKDSRLIKVAFTGNLDTVIHTNPFFYGQERHYLRAQIARISHSTTLTCKGVWRLVEDTPRDIEENTPDEGDLEWPSTKQMADPSMWVHHQP
jgi:radial spoke head protein 4A